MRPTERWLRGLTAGDVMNRALLVLPQEMSVATAAHLLLDSRGRAAPVTDALGRCVGVLSAANLLRWAAGAGGAEEEGLSPYECVWCEWQLVDPKAIRGDEVRRHMTRDPLMVTTDTPLAEIAEAFLDPRPRPVVVADRGRRPIGLVSIADILSALASADRRPEEEHPAAAPAHRRPPPRRSLQTSGAVSAGPARAPGDPATGYADERNRRRTREAGFGLHLVKPVDPEVLQGLLAASHQDVGGR